MVVLAWQVSACGGGATDRIEVPAQPIRWAMAPMASYFGAMAVVPEAGSGSMSPAGLLAFSDAAPATGCKVDGVAAGATAQSASHCLLSADESAVPDWGPLLFATVIVAVGAPVGVSVPGVPSEVTATSGDGPGTVRVNVGQTSNGGSPITGYRVESSPPGISASSTTLPIDVPCPSGCNGYAFAVSATNAVGTGASSAAVDVVTVYDLVETFREPATQPNDTIFTGSFTFNSTTGVVSGLSGHLTQSMTGGCTSLAGCAGSYGSVPMTVVPLRHQLRSQAVVLGGASGLLVTTFALTTTNTFFTVAGSDGWSPSVGVDVGGVYFGFPMAPNPALGGVGNAYAMVFINTADPTMPLTQAQVNRLAYADCTSGGMMGAVCMTGTAAAGYTGAGVGAVGTMGGSPSRR
jgi:hypothetical protein